MGAHMFQPERSARSRRPEATCRQLPQRLEKERHLMPTRIRLLGRLWIERHPAWTNRLRLDRVRREGCLIQILRQHRVRWRQRARSRQSSLLPSDQMHKNNHRYSLEKHRHLLRRSWHFPDKPRHCLK